MRAAANLGMATRMRAWQKGGGGGGLRVLALAQPEPAVPMGLFCHDELSQMVRALPLERSIGSIVLCITWVVHRGWVWWVVLLVVLILLCAAVGLKVHAHPTWC